MIRSTALVAALLLAGPGCPPSPEPPDAAPLDAAKPPGPVSPASAAACAQMASLGCREGAAGDCGVTLDHVMASRLTRIDAACLAAATSKAAVRACGGVVCE